MLKITKKQIDILVELQEIEIKTEVIKSEINKVSGKLDRLDNELKAFESEIDEEEKVINSFKQKYRLGETDLQVNNTKAEKSQEKLKLVKTNKEYQSSLKEIDEIKAINSKIEDEMLQYLENIETSEKNILKKKKNNSILAEKLKKEKVIIIQESEQGRKKVAQIEEEWKTISKKIDPKLLEKFSVVKEMVNGRAIAAVKDAVCLGCNMHIPPQTYNELQRNEKLEFCPYCQRIIYWEKD
ncbi:MAG: C4-type zinc ribbon domain-containing protein [Thermodesulfobacteriota bacterium]|nr:C4-type zinc ribbon domain-containing protein [Thermodesulfobacteriota bacterium]